MFNIEFISSEVLERPPDLSGQEGNSDEPGIDSASDEPGWRSCFGRITVGRFTERFETPLFFWCQEEYEAQWRAAISRLLAGSKKTALITAMYDPAVATFFTWWPLYRDEETVFVQNQLLLLDTLTEPFRLEEMDEYVDRRSTVDEDGAMISEWSVPLESVRRAPCLSPSNTRS